MSAAAPVRDRVREAEQAILDWADAMSRHALGIERTHQRGDDLEGGRRPAVRRIVTWEDLDELIELVRVYHAERAARIGRPS